MHSRSGEEGTEPDAEPSHDGLCSVGIQTFEQPYSLWSGGVSLELPLSVHRIYVLWNIVGAPFQLAGIHLGVGLAAWQGITHLVPGGAYAPGLVRVQRVHPTAGETWEQLRLRAVGVFRAESEVHCQHVVEEVPFYYWPASPRIGAGTVERFA
eukprot:5127379-Amphidinium_carterae.1